MVYSNKFVMAVLLNGLPQKELANGVVKLPFGAEYALRFRNKNNRRAVVKIYVDGENVSGGGYVVPANDHIDIKRHHDVDRAFKFVSLDSGEAVEHGKNGPNPDKMKGTIEARFYFEKERPYVAPVQEIHHHHWDWYRPIRPTPMPYIKPYQPYWSTCDDSSVEETKTSYGMSSQKRMRNGPGGSCGGTSMSCNAGPSASYSSDQIPMRDAAPASFGITTDCFIGAEACAKPPELKDGCTVEGYSTGQDFTTTYVSLEDTYTSLSIFLQGFEEEKRPAKAKTKKVESLEDENDELRRQIAELENEKLKKQLEDLKKADAPKPKPKRTTKKKPTSE